MSERQDNTEMKRHGKRDKGRKSNKLSGHSGDVGVKKEDSVAFEFKADGRVYSERKTKRQEKKKKKNNERSSESARCEDGYIKEVEGKLSTEKVKGDGGYRMKGDKDYMRDSKHKKETINTKDGDEKREQSEQGDKHTDEMVDGLKKKRKRRRDDVGIGLQEKCSGDMLGTNIEGDQMANSTADCENGSKKFMDGKKKKKKEEEEKKKKKKKEEEKKKKKKKKEEEKKKKKMADEVADKYHKLLLPEENMSQNVDGDIQSTEHNVRVSKKLKKNKKHKKEGKNKDDTSTSQLDLSVRVNYSNDITHSDEVLSNEVEHRRKKKKRKAEIVDNGCVVARDDEVEITSRRKKKRNKTVEDNANDRAPNKSNKKVRFSSHVEIFPLHSDLDTEEETDEVVKVVQGKRFTEEEDEILKQAVYNYIEYHGLGENGLDMVLNCKKHPEVKGCWKEIASAIPYRPHSAVYYRTQILFRRSDTRKWTKEEYELVLSHQKEHPRQWKELAEELGKHRFHVKDTWRRIKLQNLKKGRWVQSEYQNLFNLVNADLQIRVSEEKISKHGMIRDNIRWSDISDKLSTRAPAHCCFKWYGQLTSPMVAQGLWSDTDDYRLIIALYNLDATCVEDVDWDALLDHRPGDLCRRRWNQMVLHIGHHVTKSFAEQVEVLAQRYCPYLLEPREIWDSKPRVP